MKSLVHEANLGLIKSTYLLNMHSRISKYRPKRTYCQMVGYAIYQQHINWHWPKTKYSAWSHNIWSYMSSVKCVRFILFTSQPHYHINRVHACELYEFWSGKRHQEVCSAVWQRPPLWLTWVLCHLHVFLHPQACGSHKVCGFGVVSLLIRVPSSATKLGGGGVIAGVMWVGVQHRRWINVVT